MTLPVRGTVALLMFSPVNTSKNFILHSPDTFHSLSLSFINIFLDIFTSSAHIVLGLHKNEYIEKCENNTQLL